MEEKYNDRFILRGELSTHIEGLIQAWALLHTREEITDWSEGRDPIASLENLLKKQGILTAEESETIQQQEAEDIQAAVTFAEESPYPGPEELYKDVYSYEIS